MSKFKIFYRTKFIDDSVLNFIKQKMKWSCIVNPHENFNKNDVKLPFLCNIRLVAYAKSIKKDYYILMFQEGTDYGISSNCLLFEFTKSGLNNIVKLEVSKSIDNFKMLINALKKDKYQAYEY